MPAEWMREAVRRVPRADAPLPLLAGNMLEAPSSLWETADESRRPIPTRDGAGANVLLVDDNPANLLALEAILSPLAVRLVKAHSGEQALRQLLGEDFAVILLDVQMEGLDGFETAGLIKQRERTRNIPIIFLTAYGNDERDVKAGYATGAVDYLQKPFSADVLRSKVAVFIELFQAQQQIRRQAELLRQQEAVAREAAHRAAYYIAQLQTLTSRLGEATSVEQVMTALFEQGMSPLGANAGSVCLLDSSEQMLEIVQAVGYPEEMLRRWRRMPLDSRVPLTDAVLQERPVWLGSREDWRARYPELEPQPSSAAAAALPLLVKGRVLGAIGLSFGQEPRFNEDDRAFFTAVAHACAQAIDRAQLYEEERLATERVRAAAARLQVLTEASDAFSAANRDLPALFEAITQQVVRHLGDSCILTLRMQDLELLETVSVRHVDPALQERMIQTLSATPIKLGEGLNGRVAQTGQAQWSASTTLEELQTRSQPEHSIALEHIPIHSYLAAPLRVQGRVIGTVSTARSTPGRPFNREDLRLLEELANKAALSIENARFFQQQQRDQEELRRRTEFEQQLIGIVSHDLRNPLGAITMAAGLLQASPGLSDRQLKAAQRIASSCERATRLIRDFLDFTQARLGAGIPLKRRDMDLDEVTRQVVDEVLQANPERQVRVEPGGDVRGEWDPDRIAQVLTNLVGNALAYSPPDTPVEVRTRAVPGFALLEIHNTGTPISPELLPRLFEPLTRGAPTAGQHSRSIGLGLYIVREIVRGHGGTVEVASSREQGTTFTVRLSRA